MGLRSKVVTFSKDVSAAPVSQAITGVGFTPRAVIFFMVNTITDGTGRSDVRSCVGFSGKDAADVIDSWSAAWASDHGADPMNASRKLGNKAITIIEWGETLLAEADMTSFDVDGFTLNWTTNNGIAYRIMALCLGGTSLTAAKAFSRDAPAATGAQAITGIGFQPECLLLARTNGNTTASGSAGFSLGASDGVNSWLVSLFDTDNVATSDVARGQRTGQIIGTINNTAAWSSLASLTSFDADGFTLNWSARSSTNPNIGLALNGGSYVAGTTAKSASTAVPVSQAVSGLGFEPAAVLNVSVFGGSLTGAGTTDAPLSIGAVDHAGAMAVGASRQTNSSATGSSQSYNRVDKVVDKFTNNTNTILAEASQVIDVDGFTWSWTTNDAVASNIAWLAFGPDESPAPSPGGGNSQVIIAG